MIDGFVIVVVVVVVENDCASSGGLIVVPVISINELIVYGTNALFVAYITRTRPPTSTFSNRSFKF